MSTPQSPSAEQVIRILDHVAHEALVYLEHADRQAFQIGQRGITGAEVVQGEIYTELLVSVDHPGHF